MKTIVVATDFSAEAENAMNYAARLAQEINASVSVLHVYQMPMSMADMPVMMVSAEEIKKNVDVGLSQGKELLQKNYPQVQIETESRLGDVVTELNDFCKKAEPVAIVIGTKNFSGLEKLLFGNTALSIIRHSYYPVICIPPHSKMSSPKNIVLATDLMTIDEIPAEKIISIVQLFKAKLHVVHVKETEQEDENAKDKLLQRLQVITPAFHSVGDEDVLHGLQTYVQQNNVDVLLSLPHKHNLYERLFFKLHTDGLIEKMSVPVMCLQN